MYYYIFLFLGELYITNQLVHYILIHQVPVVYHQYLQHHHPLHLQGLERLKNPSVQVAQICITQSGGVVQEILIKRKILVLHPNLPPWRPGEAIELNFFICEDMCVDWVFGCDFNLIFRALLQFFNLVRGVYFQQIMFVQVKTSYNNYG